MSLPVCGSASCFFDHILHLFFYWSLLNASWGFLGMFVYALFNSPFFVFVCVFLFCFVFFNYCCGTTGICPYLFRVAEMEGGAKKYNYHESQCLLVVIHKSGPPAY